jgi:hypothetical protein
VPEPVHVMFEAVMYIQPLHGVCRSVALVLLVLLLQCCCCCQLCQVQQIDSCSYHKLN